MASEIDALDRPSGKSVPNSATPSESMSTPATAGDSNHTEIADSSQDARRSGNKADRGKGGKRKKDFGRKGKK
jgi:hypothetical protein